MIVTQERIDANRRNALKSTGPRTVEGKNASRMNSLKHGLCASVVVPEDAELVQTRGRRFFHTLRPQNDFHCWLVSEISLTTIRIDRVERQERRARDKVAIKSELTWDDDRAMEATVLGGQLGTNPEVVVDQLMRSPHGCDWLMGRWAMLAHAADVQGAWTPDQVELAFDLLGTPRQFRVGHKPGTELDFEGRVLHPGDDPAAVARRQVAELKRRREVVATLDEINRALTTADLGNDTDRELKLLRRYEASLHARLRWCMKQLQAEAPHKAPAPWLEGNWVAEFEPRPKVEDAPPPPIPSPKAEVARPARPPGSGAASIHPPIDLTPEECPPIGQDPDIPAILKARQQKKLDRAESRRQAKRRKIERLLG